MTDMFLEFLYRRGGMILKVTYNITEDGNE